MTKDSNPTPHQACVSFFGSLARANREEKKIIRQNGEKMLFMKVFQWNNIVAGLLVLMFAAILLGDSILVTYTSAGEVLSPNDVKGIVGFTFLLIATFILVKARESK